LKLKKLIDWVLGLFKKPKEEMSIEFEVWPFPVEKPKRRPQVKKATTRKPAVKKPAVKKPVAKKTVKKKAK
jgi:hypothetical protein